MKRTSARRTLIAGLAVAAAGLLATTLTTVAGASTSGLGKTSAHTTALSCVRTISTPAREGRMAGIVNPAVNGNAVTCVNHNSNAAIGAPPLLYNGGPVMGTNQTGDLVITPIFWSPADHQMPASYQGLLTQYLNDVALSSARTNNVYSISTEYSGTNGQIQLGSVLGTPITDTNPLPEAGCQLTKADTSNIYVDGTGYDTCIDDTQVTTEIDNIIAAQGLPVNLSHIYVMYLPKHVESCFNPGETTSTEGGQ